MLNSYQNPYINNLELFILTKDLKKIKIFCNYKRKEADDMSETTTMKNISNIFKTIKCFLYQSVIFLLRLKGVKLLRVN